MTDTETPTESPTPKPRKRSRWLLLIAVACFIATGYLLYTRSYFDSYFNSPADSVPLDLGDPPPE